MAFDVLEVDLGVCGQVCMDGLGYCWTDCWRVGVGLVLDYIEVVEGVRVDVECRGVV